MTAILDGNLIWQLDLGDDHIEVYWTPGANEMALTLGLEEDGTDIFWNQDFPVSDIRAMAFAILDATGGREG